MAGEGAKVFYLSQRSRRRIQSQIETGGAGDVSIVVSAADSRGRSKIQVLKGHKALLASWSPVLRAAFADAEASGHAAWIQLSRVDAVALKSLLDAFYKGEMTLDYRGVWRMRRVAQRLNIEQVVKLCNEYVKDGVNAENCLQFLIEARKCGSDDLEAAARAMAVSSFDTIRNGKEFLNLECDLYVSILEEARERHSLSELSVLCCALQWVEHSQEDRREGCPAMLSRLGLHLKDDMLVRQPRHSEGPIPDILRAVSLAVGDQRRGRDCQGHGPQDSLSAALPAVDSLFGLEECGLPVEALRRMMNGMGMGEVDIDSVFCGGIKAGTKDGDGLYAGGIKAVPDRGEDVAGMEVASGQEPVSSGSGTIGSDAFTPTWRDEPPPDGDTSDASEDVPECVAPYAHGILSNVEIADLKDLGWRVVYGKPCVQDTSAEDLERLPGDFLLVGVALKGESTLRLAAMGRRDRILRRTRPGETNAVNGAFWHLEPGHSFGFSASPKLAAGSGRTTVEVRGKRMAWRLAEGESTLMGFTSPRAEWSADRRGPGEECARKWLKLVFSWQHAVCGHAMARETSQSIASDDMPTGG
ncbi:unnamed protein product [Ostreobium quekettii]|uniref:BTB domain-containing protein n=1 Tax=Ostreobium quekettii TaxID=121088 RepID=A0A8S1IPC3_9CHLO|nr:unnamed protein product [Ostreobium quekettii]